jgi:DNA-binding NarL/FixJ family response regulator
MSSEQDPITVVLCSDSFLIGDGLASLLSDVSDVEVVGRARDLNALPTLVADLAPRAVIISIRSQVVTTSASVSAARHLRDTHPTLCIMVISDRTNDFALDVLRGGSSRIAFLLDDQLPGIEEVLGSLRQLNTGHTILDPSIVDTLIRRGDGADGARSFQSGYRRQTAHFGEIHREGDHRDLPQTGALQLCCQRSPGVRGSGLPAHPDRSIRTSGRGGEVSSGCVPEGEQNANIGRRGLSDPFALRGRKDSQVREPIRGRSASLSGRVQCDSQ